MRDVPLLNRFLHHVLALVLASALAFVCMLLGTPLAVATGDALFFVLAISLGVGWMLGGLLPTKDYPESGPMLASVVTGLGWWAIEVRGYEGSAMRGLVELLSLCLGAAGTGWLVLRSDRKARLRTAWTAVGLASAIAVLALQFRVPGRRTALRLEDGRLERVILAQPLTEDWRNDHAAHPISRADDAVYVWRAGALTSRSSEIMCSRAEWSGLGPCYQLTRLTDPAEIEAAYQALWATEEWLLGWEVARRDLPFFMLALAPLRGDWRRGSVWRAEPCEPPAR